MGLQKSRVIPILHVKSNENQPDYYAIDRGE